MGSLVHRRASVLVVGTLALLILAAGPVAAHAEHEALPDGFRAAFTGYADSNGQPAQLPGVHIEAATDGGALTVANTGSEELIIMGEQAGEPVLRFSGGSAYVNARSPQAAGVEGADVDPAAVADLLDLVWERVEPQWVPLAATDAVTVMDHRGSPGHPPVRSEYRTGDVVGEFGVEFTYAGETYKAEGTITAVEPEGGGAGEMPWAVVLSVGVALAAAAAAVIAIRQMRHGPAVPAKP